MARRAARPLRNAPGTPALKVPADADILWIIDTLDHLPDLNSALQEVLPTVRCAITEDVRTSRAHGNQRFHQRRTAHQLGDFFTQHSFAPEPQTTATSHLTIWLRREESMPQSDAYPA